MRRPPDYSASRFASAEKTALSYIVSEGISDAFSGGVLLALSGGADSVFLLHLLARLAAKQGFSLLAVHVNHHLRGDEADRDAAFCYELCADLGVRFVCVDVDVAAEQKCGKFGVEEAARRVRYRALYTELEKRPELSCIATAHHGTDQLETVLFQLLRGGALHAAVGMPPVRLPIVRPLLCLSRREIVSALEDAGCGFVTDSTNSDIGYARNYLRCEILPRLSRINREPERAILRTSEALAHDAALLDELAGAAYAAAPRRDEGVDAAYLLSLHEALRRRVIVLLYEEKREKEASHIALEHTHIVSISELLRSGRASFSVAVPNRLYAVLENGVLSFRRTLPTVVGAPTERIPIVDGENTLPGGFSLSVRRDKDEVFVRCFSFLHKIDITTAISSDIINGELYVRGRMPRDSYRFRSHTHSLKKLYNEAKIPLAIRSYLPVLCDQSGILWVPFFPVREKTCTD